MDDLIVKADADVFIESIIFRSIAQPGRFQNGSSLDVRSAMNRRLREGTAAGQRGDVRRKYVLGKVLGSGSFSRVTEGTCKATAKTFAIKSTILSRFPDVAMRQDLMNETKLMLALDHPNIARTFEFYLDDEVDTMHIVLEMLTGGDLMSKLEIGTAIEEHRAAAWVLQMLNAIAYCHERRVCHRDLKPENFCFQSRAADAPLKLLDFGCSKLLATPASTMTKKVGTWDYMAPEQIPSIDSRTGQRSRYGLGVDLWSIGVISYILLGMEFPFGWCADAERDAQADFTQVSFIFILFLFYFMYIRYVIISCEISHLTIRRARAPPGPSCI